MASYSLDQVDRNSSLKALSDWETAVVDLFLNAAQSVGLPKSFGQIYGLLFCRDEPLSMDAIMELLFISKGSASQGLKALRHLGAVRNTFVPGERREHFVAEIRLRKLVAGFLKDQIEPHLEKGKDRLSHIADMLEATEDEKETLRGERRLKILAGWHRQVGKLLPLVKMIVGKADKVPDKSS